MESAFGGQYHSVFKGRGMNFEDVRAYNAGDEVRFIDRNVTARTGDLHVKNFTEERELTVLLVVDVSASGAFGSVSQSKRELAAEVASLLAFSAIGNCDKVGLLLFSDARSSFSCRRARVAATCCASCGKCFTMSRAAGKPILRAPWNTSTASYAAGRWCSCSRISRHRIFPGPWW